MNTENDTRRVLVTGGAGFIGAHLVRALILKGARVVVADRQPRSIASPFRVFGLDHSAEYLKVDLSSRIDVERSIFGEFDTIFHLAAQPIGYISREIPNQTMSSNVDSTKLMLDFVRGGRAQQLIFVSSACAFGVPDASKCPLKEDSRMSPGLYPYTESKQRAEKLVRDSGVKAVIARFVNVFGEADWHVSRIVPRIARQLSLGLPLSLSRSNGRSVLDFLYVSDAVAALLRLNSYISQVHKTVAPEPVFNFAFGRPISILGLVQEICMAFDGQARHVAVPSLLIEPQMHKYLDCTRATNDLGWKPMIERGDGLRKTLSWHRRYGFELYNIDGAVPPPEHELISTLNSRERLARVRENGYA